MKYRIYVLLINLIFSSDPTLGNYASTVTLLDSTKSDKNQLVVEYVRRNGPIISSTYEKAVCTELVIKVLQHFVFLSKEDKKRIRIITDKNLMLLRLNKSPIPAGVHYALTANGKGVSVDKVKDVKPGDFVQFWTLTWGHCGIVKSVNVQAMTME